MPAVRQHFHGCFLDFNEEEGLGMRNEEQEIKNNKREMKNEERVLRCSSSNFL